MTNDTQEKVILLLLKPDSEDIAPQLVEQLVSKPLKAAGIPADISIDENVVYGGDIRFALESHKFIVDTIINGYPKLTNVTLTVSELVSKLRDYFYNEDQEILKYAEVITAYATLVSHLSSPHMWTLPNMNGMVVIQESLTPHVKLRIRPWVPEEIDISQYRCVVVKVKFNLPLTTDMQAMS
jgi:hypothetical protein